MQTVDQSKVNFIVKKRQSGYTLKEIAQELGISHQRVHQLYKHSKLFENTHHTEHLKEDYDEIYASKEYSYYYEVLTKQYGKEKADFIWDCRNFEHLDIWNHVKHYKPKNPLVAIDYY